MNLYNIPEETVCAVIESRLRNSGLEDGKHEILEEEVGPQYRYPLKVVFLVSQNRITVITVYPLKKGLKK